MSDFYLMTRAAYAKLSRPVAKAALRAGLTPDSITIIGTAGTVIAALTLYPIGQLWWGSVAVAFFVLADMLDGAMARERGGGTRFGAVLDATCDRIADGAIFAGLAWWAAFGMDSPPLVVATLICLVTSQLISYIKARAEASGLEGGGGLIERPERLSIVAARRGAIRPVRGAVVVAFGDVDARGGQRDHLRAAVAHRAHIGGCDGAAAKCRRRETRDERAVTTTPAGPKTERGSRFPLGGQLSDWGYAAGWRLVRAMPELVARNAFEAGAIYASRNGGPEQLRKNLARVIGVPPAQVPDGLIRASLASYARYWREAFRLPTMDHEAVGRELSVQGIEHLSAALDAGQGAVLALPHSGNWDLAGVWLVQNYGTPTTVVERLQPESLYNRFLAYRESLGFEILPLTGGDRPPSEVLAERLRDNRVVGLMAERDLTRAGVQVDFFGEPTRMPAGPAKLAIETGAALLPVHCWYEGDGWGMRVYPALDTSSEDVTVITQALADRFARNIAAHPADWHMLQPQWLADLSEERRAQLGAT